MILTDLASAGFDIHALNHAKAVLERDFPQAMSELCDVLLGITISVEELVRGGGGESPVTQRLRRALDNRGWTTRQVTIRKIVDDEERASTTHKIDHVRSTESGTVALEIEWNNKDPFFDRDLENFQRLHLEGVISVGVIITRGSSLQTALHRIVLDFAHQHHITGFDDLTTFGYSPTARQQREVERRLVDSDFATAWSRAFVTDKFGASTTHWAKLQDRVRRGVGNPCPLLLIGIPAQSVQETHEDIPEHHNLLRFERD